MPPRKKNTKRSRSPDSNRGDGAREVTFRVNDVTSSGELKTTSIKAAVKKHGMIKTLVDAGGISTGHPPLVEATMASHAFLDAALLAFNHHRPLVLKPTHIWLMITQGLASHVLDNAEALRDKWVMHDGKKEITIRRDEFVKFQPNNWAGTVPEFVAQIRANTVAGVVDMLTPNFSTTTETERVACGITVMEIVKSFFDSRCTTCCGYPSITLDGTPEDWARLHTQSLELVSR